MCALVPVHTCMTEDVHLTELDLDLHPERHQDMGLKPLLHIVSFWFVILFVNLNDICAFLLLILGFPRER